MALYKRAGIIFHMMPINSTEREKVSYMVD